MPHGISIEPDVDDLKIKKICCNCVMENFLSAEIRKKGIKGKCSYCKKVRRCYSLEEMAERVDTAFQSHYQLSDDQPTPYEAALMADRESNYERYRDGEPVTDAIMNAAEIPEAAAEDIQKILGEKYYSRDADQIGEETAYSADTNYEACGVDDKHWQIQWDEFERKLKTESRFFSGAAEKYLETVFQDLGKMITSDNRPIIVKAGPNTGLAFLYRARVFQSRDKLKTSLKTPDRYLGSPQSVFAIAGRMNARGVSVFYGASDAEVALSEVRPPVGSEVAVARFEMIRSLKLLDLTALSIATVDGSIFDETYIMFLEKAAFLRRLSKTITAPVMPDDEEFAYLATQAIADYLAANSTYALDGIIFPSSQLPGKGFNVVLFHKAARVEKLRLPKGAQIEVQLEQFDEDGPYPDYTIFERITTAEKNKAVQGVKKDHEKRKLAYSDSRIPSIKISRDSISIYIIESVEYKAQKHEVSVHSIEDRGMNEFRGIKVEW